MKKTLYTLALAVLTSISLLSCSKGEYNSADGQKGLNPFMETKPTEGVFKAKINGTDFTADKDNCYAYLDSSNGYNTTIYGIKGSGSLPQSISFTFYGFLAGKYLIYPNEFTQANAYYTPAGATSHIKAETGELEIKSTYSEETYKWTMKGTFKFRGPDLEVTDGSFEIPLEFRRR
jgi:hypothetical protein